MIRDPAKFPSLVHATKRDPASNLPDSNMVRPSICSFLHIWVTNKHLVLGVRGSLRVYIVILLMLGSYFNNHPEGYNALMRIFSDEGTPKSYSRMQASSVHCYTFTKKVAGT